LKKLTTIALFLCYFIQITHAQKNDAAVWENIYLEKQITPRFKIHLNHEGRITENITQFRYGYADFGVSYKFNKNFHTSIDYVFVEKYLDKSGLSYRHQYYISFTYKKKVDPFIIYFRQMFQDQVQDIYSSSLGKLPVYFSRSKVTIKCELNRYTPYIASELYVRLSEPYSNNPESVSQPNGIHANRVRYFAGFFYELNKMNFVELYYMIEKHFNENDPLTNYVIGIGYAHEFY
jgi:hypothetical protein